MNKLELKKDFFLNFLPTFEPVKMTDSSDVALKKILNFLYYFQEDWMFWSNGDFWVTYGTDKCCIKIRVFEHPFRDRREHALIKLLIKKGYSGGCDCGCRGDLTITDEGLELIGKKRVLPYVGY